MTVSDLFLGFILIYNFDTFSIQLFFFVQAWYLGNRHQTTQKHLKQILYTIPGVFQVFCHVLSPESLHSGSSHTLVGMIPQRISQIKGFDTHLFSLNEKAQFSCICQELKFNFSWGSVNKVWMYCHSYRKFLGSHQWRISVWAFPIKFLCFPDIYSFGVFLMHPGYLQKLLFIIHIRIY